MTVKAKVDAIDRFVRTLKSGGLYDDIGSAAIMAGWTNLAGALYPFKGSAPTNNGFLAADLDAGIGLKGNGSSKYLDSNRNNNADGQDDNHNAVYITATPTVPSSAYAGAGFGDSGTNLLGDLADYTAHIRSRSSTLANLGAFTPAGLFGHSRSNSAQCTGRVNGSSQTFSVASQTPYAANVHVFGRNASTPSRTTARLSFYSIGTALDLAALDSAVSTLMADLRAIDEDGFDRDALAYIRAVEAADGSFLETGVKQAINSFIVGCKKDGIWDALKASCILCGARTIAGALVPLAGTAPTAYGGWASGDYNRETGLVGNGTTKYLDTNRAGDADGQNDFHAGVYCTSLPTDAVATAYLSNVPPSGVTGATLFSRTNVAPANNVWRCRSSAAVSDAAHAGLLAASRSESSQFLYANGQAVQAALAASETRPSSNFFLFASAGGSSLQSDARLAFYSIGSAVDLAALDARVSTLVSQIAAAIP